ncbi:TlpA disulfide reductase family protein [Flavobacterium sp.]|uniref:TlpA family protein disulfide reductase n=1 Tax=Flavobacterium sp. TaxID=239 RepID=UPI00286D7230|nr:TlpA disulfide reductase family protein [Flavobacterium sp.]
MKKGILFLFFLSFSIQAQVKVGDSLPIFTLKNANNEEVSSISFKNKYVLIDFWASWCAPCRKGNKELVQLHKEIDSSKFEIVGISVDTDIEKWKKSIEKDSVKYTQVHDPNGFDAKTAVLFGVEVLPSQFLFDTTGILIAINPTKAEINTLLKR